MRFNTKWQNETEKSLYVYQDQSPVTQRQFFYRQYWRLVDFHLHMADIYKKEHPQVLDLGCGRGTISEYLTFDRHLKPCLVDNSKKALDLAWGNLFKWGVDRFIKAEATELPFSDSSFDAIISVGLAEHIDDYVLFIDEQLRVLKGGGVIVCFIIPNKFSPQVLNVFGSDKYHRTSIDVDQYRRVITENPQVSYETKVEWINYFPLFTPIPKCWERPITWLYEKITNLIGFKGPKLLCQTAILTIKKF